MESKDGGHVSSNHSISNIIQNSESKKSINFDSKTFQKVLQQKRTNFQHSHSDSSIKQITYQDKGKYNGTIVKSKREGYGEYNYPNSDHYRGQWKNDLPNLMGVYAYAANKKCYYGQFINGKPNGKGNLVTDDGKFIVCYDGHWKNGLKHGYGIYYYSKQEYYQGNWANGIKEGQGIYVTDKQVYKGEWQNNMRNGKGILTTKEGVAYNGIWRNDQLNLGIISFPKNESHDVYQGQIQIGLRHGQGIYKYNDGTKHQGMHNIQLKRSNYQGNYVNNKKQGQGVYTYQNGDMYEGTFVDNKKQGKNCTYKWKDGSVFTGNFLEDSIQKGNYTDHSDKIEKQIINGYIIS